MRGLTTEIKQSGDNIGQLPVNLTTAQLRINPLKYGWNESLLLTDAKIAQLKSLEIKSIISVDGFPEFGTYNQTTPDFWNNQNDLDEVIRFADEISNRYVNENNILAYQFMSEPVLIVDGVSLVPSGWGQLNKDIIETIQRNDKKKKIITTVAPWGLPRNYQNFKPLPYERLIYGAHYYQPHPYTHQGIGDYTDIYAYPALINNVLWDKKRIAEELNHLKNFGITNNVQIYIGEFSCVRWAENSEIYLRDIINLFDQYNWSWMYWLIDSWHGWNPNYNDSLSENWQDDYIGYTSKRWQLLKEFIK